MNVIAAKAAIPSQFGDPRFRGNDDRSSIFFRIFVP